MNKIRCAIFAALLLVTGCTRPDHTREVLEAQGFKEVQITGYRWFSCADDDEFHTGFRAKAPNGKTVKGTVCAGWLSKGATVRYD